MAAIRNFGHFWTREGVHWNLGGKEGSKGHLKGHHGRGARRKIINFRLQSGIYVLFAPNREVIYVGQVGSGEKRRLFGRLKQHTRDHLRDRWTHFSWFGLCETDPNTGDLKAFESSVSNPREILDELEAILIHLFEPRLNMQRAKWKDATEYIQHTRQDDENLSDEGEED